VAGKLLRDGLIEEISAHGALATWRRDEDKGALAPRITRRGLAAVGVAKDSALLETEESAAPGKGPIPHATSLPVEPLRRETKGAC
jgi:hypothetical protein